MRVITVANQKGGCAKTTTVVNLAASLAELGKKVLVIDLDPQGNASDWLGSQNIEDAAFRLLTEKSAVDALIEDSNIEHVQVIRASRELAQVEKALAGELSIETKLKRRLTALFKNSQWDFVLIDTPPTLGILTVNALTAASELLVPVTAHVMSLSGVAQLLATFEEVQEMLNPDLKIAGFVASRVDMRTRHARDVMESLKESFGDQVFTTLIRENVLLAEAPSFQEPILSYKTKSTAAEDYRNLAKELIKKAKKS
jgi:chromosome partitioning protein